MSKYNNTNTLLSKKEQSLPDKEKQKLIEIRKKDEELRIKNDIEAQEREIRVLDRLKRKLDSIQKEQEELELACMISKKEYIKRLKETVDLSVFEDNWDLHQACLNLIYK
jgi:hypothetical protein